MSRAFSIGSKKLEFTHTAVNRNAHLFIDGTHDPELCPECIKPGTLVFSQSTKLPVTDMSKEAVDMHYASLLLTNAMSHGAEVIKYASMVVAAGPARDRKQMRKIFDNFKSIHKQFSDREADMLKKFEKETES